MLVALLEAQEEAIGGNSQLLERRNGVQDLMIRETPGETLFESVLEEKETEVASAVVV